MLPPRTDLRRGGFQVYQGTRGPRHVRGVPAGGELDNHMCSLSEAESIPSSGHGVEVAHSYLFMYVAGHAARSPIRQDSCRPR